jgi:hypothetical protein
MVGLDIPVIPVEHQYIVTEPHPEIVKRKQQGLPEMGVLREADASYYMREENGGLLLGPYEFGRTLLLRGRPAKTPNTNCSSRPRASRALYRSLYPSRPGIRRSRCQEHLQRRHLLHPRWFADHRAGMGSAQFLAQRGAQLRYHRRRRRRLADRRVDRGGRAEHRHDGCRSATLRSLCVAWISAGKERGGLSQRIYRALSGRGARRRPSPEARTLLRPHEGTWGRVRHGLRLGASQLVRTGGLRPHRGAARQARYPGQRESSGRAGR